MCGRYALILSGQIRDLPFVEESATQLDLELPWECYNVAPTMRVPIVDSDGGLKLSTWGLIPHWSKAPPKRPLVNARVETAEDKASFREAFKSHHCAIPTSGFFEWTGSDEERVPHFIGPASGGLLWLAGLACSWKGPDGQRILSHAVLTRPSEGTRVEELHDRCPVTLSQDTVKPWLTGAGDLEAVTARDPFGKPYRVSTDVNKAANDSPANLEPI